MTMTCRTCRHPDRQAIDRALVAGEPESAVARKFGLARTSVQYHHANHLKPALAAKASELDKHHGSIVTHLVVLLDKALEIMGSPDDQRTALMAVREARGVLETLGQVSGELLPTQVQQVYISLGVRDEGELRRILEDHRRLRAASGDEALDDAERDAVEALRLVLAERPERADAIRAALFDASSAEVVE